MPGMSDALPALIVLFVAFCIWLTVRIVNRRERWAKWTAWALVAGLAYPLSFGPACWWLSKEAHAQEPIVDFRRVPSAYWPIGFVALHGPKFSRIAINWYATLGIDGPLYLSSSDESVGILFHPSMSR